MKRKILIALGIVVLIFGILIALPFLFKDKLLTTVKNTLNNQVNAKIDFADFSLSVFPHFPRVEMALKNLSVVGENEFAGDTIFSAGTISTTISLSDLFRSKGLELNSLIVDNPRVLLISDKAGKVNWNIVKPSGTSEKTTVSQPEASGNEFKMKLNDIQVRNLNLHYSDEAMPMNVWVKNTSLNSSGEVAGAVTTFNLKGEAGELVLNYDSVQYISKTRLKAETLLKVDYDKMNFAFDQGKLWINNLPLQLEGSFAMPNDSMNFDLSFRSEKSDFATILALVPTDYQKYLAKADIKGSAEFKGSVKGLYYNEIYPAIDVQLATSNASFKYQDLPESIQDIQVSAQITKPEGELNLLKVNVDKAHASIRNNPVDLQFQLSDLMTDPDISGAFSGTVDFATLKQALPLDSLDLTGILKAKLQVAGRMSSIEKKQYEKFQSNGEASLQNFKIVSNKLTRPVEISSGQVKVNTSQIEVSQFAGKIGQSDFSVQGKVSNYLAYVFKNDVLSGNFNLKSGFMNLNELSNIQKPEKDARPAAAPSAAGTKADSVVAFQVPDKLDLSFRSQIQRAVYNQIPITNIIGLVTIKNRRLDLTGLTMDMLQGKVSMNGSYTSNGENKPLFDFKFDMSGIDLPTASQSLSTFQRYAPITSRSQGKISMKFGLTGSMDDKMNIVPTSLNGDGLFNTQNLMIVDSPVFDQIRGIIRKEKLKNVKIDDFTANFQFENGALKLNPFKTKVADQEATVSGSLSADLNLNLNMDFLVNRDDLGTDINKGLGILPGTDNIKIIPATVVLKGPISKPEVSLDLSKARTLIEQEVKKASTEQIKQSVKKIGDELKKLFK